MCAHVTNVKEIKISISPLQLAKCTCLYSVESTAFLNYVPTAMNFEILPTQVPLS